MLLANEQLATLGLDGAFAYSINLSPMNTYLALAAVGKPSQAGTVGSTHISRFDMAKLGDKSAASKEVTSHSESIELPAIIVSPEWSTDEQSLAFLMSSQKGLTLEILSWSEAASKSAVELTAGEWAMWLIASPFNFVSWTP